MNAKKCKALRRAARGATVGMPAVAYMRTQRAKDPTTGRYYLTGTVTLYPLCTRAVYQAMKREARRAA